MICDWLANRECLFKVEFFLKYLFKKKEKIRT